MTINHPIAPSASHLKSQLRQTLRAQRRALPVRERRRRALAMGKKLTQLSAFRSAQRIAVFFAADGEIDPAWLTQLAWQRGKQVFLPVLTPSKQLLFAGYQRGTPLRKNRYGILEPIPNRRNLLDPRQLDLVLTPLVAFDTCGHRLGMGGGFYDQTFAFLKQHPRRRPRLLGLAYDFQRCQNLPSEAWDVPLSIVVTDKQVYRNRIQPSLA